ncbi:uncharacterized protein LOC100367108 [Saccoglossus kowalevskii]|uniref:Uncharacterized protein LOC100367108 n=1 Tax=Saccoglossus kowalevskii TaxID=10224 RepID=A0ABM0M0T6_SACKO|nr:PREDICTED: uncharacterized protein LOC100367108 [Saccoglossus kowalevskii]
MYCVIVIVVLANLFWTGSGVVISNLEFKSDEGNHIVAHDNDNCIGYEFWFDKKMSWDEAADACGCKLAVVNDRSLFNKLRRFINQVMLDNRLQKPKNKGYWIGASDKAEELSFEFYCDSSTSSGITLPLEYPPWYEDQPNNHMRDGIGQNCVQMWNRDGNNAFKLDDDWCADEKSFICQFPLSCCSPK